MTPREPQRPELEPGDERLLARLREAYRPEPLTRAQRAAFDAALQARLERRRVRLWMPVLALGAAAALLSLVLVAPEREPAGAGPRVAALEHEAWAAELLLSDGAGYGEEDAAAGDDLPPQYAAIASLLGP